MVTVNDVILRIQKIERTEAIGDIADVLGLSRTALSNHKRRNTIPYEKLHFYAIKKGIPLDLLLMSEEGPDMTIERSGDYRELRIEDDTMAPTLEVGDIVKYEEKPVTSVLFGLFIIDIKGKRCVRRIQEMPDSVKVICDNPLYAESDYDRKTVEAMLLGPVLCRTTFFGS